MKRLVDEGPLGEGGMAQIRRVRDVNLQRTVAMKVLLPEQAEHERGRLRFLHEARTTAQLAHPNIVPVHEIGLDPDGTCFFTMERVDGDTLEDLIHREGSSPDRLRRLLDILITVCTAVSYAHAQGVLHRDLKPANVMVGAHGQIYVMDWGIATRMGAAGAEGLDVPGEVVGSLGYMPPEQLQQGRIDERTDVFGLGAILYEMLTRRPPFQGETLRAVAARTLKGHVAPPEALAADIPPALSRIVRKALSRSPEDRYPSVAAFAEELARFLRGGGHFEVRRLPAGTRIVSQGEPGDEAYVIQKGRCRVFRVRHGVPDALGELGPLDVFGEQSAITGRARSAYVEAIDDVELLVVTRETLQGQLGLDSVVGAFVRALGDRFVDADRQVDDLQARWHRAELAARVAIHVGRHPDGARWRVLADELVAEGRFASSDLVQAVQAAGPFVIDLVHDRIRLRG